MPQMKSKLKRKVGLKKKKNAEKFNNFGDRKCCTYNGGEGLRTCCSCRRQGLEWKPGLCTEMKVYQETLPQLNTNWQWCKEKRLDYFGLTFRRQCFENLFIRVKEKGNDLKWNGTWYESLGYIIGLTLQWLFSQDRGSKEASVRKCMQKSMVLSLQFQSSSSTEMYKASFSIGFLKSCRLQKH